MKLCNPCRQAHTHPHFRNPLHVVHPVTWKRQVYDVRGVAVCPTCPAVWYRGRQNLPELIGLR